MLHNLYGEDLPESEVLAQRLSGAGALVLQLVNDLVLGDGANPGHIDIEYGWDASPDTLTPLADLATDGRAVVFFMLEVLDRGQTPGASVVWTAA